MRVNAPRRKSAAAKIQEVALRRAEVVRLQLRGYSVRQIAKTLGIAVGTVSKDQHAALQEVRDRIAADRGALLAQEVQQLLDERKEALEAFEASKTPCVKVKTSGIEITKIDPTTGKKTVRMSPAVRVEKITEERTGDPQYLARLMAIHQRVADLLGLDAPKESKIKHGGELGLHRDPADASDLELAARLLAIAAEGREGPGGEGRISVLEALGALTGTPAGGEGDPG